MKFLLSLAGLLALSTHLHAAALPTYYVDPDGDDNSPDGTDPSSPFATIAKALDAATSGSRIHAAEGTYTLSNLLIDKSIAIQGAGPDLTIFQGAETPGTATHRLSTFNTGHQIYIDGLTLKNGVGQPGSFGDDGKAGGCLNLGSHVYLNNVKICGNRSASGSFGGGGIFNAGGALTITNSTIMQNEAPGGGNGGGLALIGGSATILNTDIEYNFAGDQTETRPAGIGGGVYVGPDCDPATFKFCTLEGNRAGNGNPGFGGSGGGISNQGNLFVKSSLFLHNCAGNGGAALDGANGGFGGGLINYDTATIKNTTFTHNHAGHAGLNSGFGGSGGALDSTLGTLSLKFCTITGNSAGMGASFDGYGSGIHANTGTPVITVKNSILYGNTVLPNGGGTDAAGNGITSAGHNVFGDTSPFAIANPGLGDLGDNPLLGTLADNGGPTLSLRPLKTSVAIDNVALTIGGLVTDQLGNRRGTTTATGAVDPAATILDPDDIGVQIEVTPYVDDNGSYIRLNLNNSSSEMQYQVFQGDTVSQLSIPEVQPGGRMPVTSPTRGTNGPMLFQLPFLSPFLHADGRRKEKSFLVIIVTPYILDSPLEAAAR